jgi:hypothetical protein
MAIPLRLGALVDMATRVPGPAGMAVDHASGLATGREGVGGFLSSFFNSLGQALSTTSTNPVSRSNCACVCVSVGERK